MTENTALYSIYTFSQIHSEKQLVRTNAIERLR